MSISALTNAPTADFAARLRGTMAQEHLSVRQLAAATGISAASIRRYMRGTEPRGRHLIALTDALGMDPHVLLGTPDALLGEFAQEASHDTEPNWSPSRIQDYLRCPALYWFRHVAPSEKEPASPEAALGHAVHRAIEVLYQGAPLAQAAQQIPLDLAAELEGTRPPLNGDEEPPDPEALAEEGRAMLALYAREVAARVNPVVVEQRVEVRAGDATLTVVVDVISADGMVRDTKTTKRKPSVGDLDSNLQATALSMAYRELLGEPERGIAFDYLIRRGPDRHGPRPPEYLELTTARNGADYDRFKRIVEGVMQAAARGNFYPNPVNKFGCRGCSFRERCNEVFV